MNQKPQILAVVGPTATGKSALAVELALRLRGEVVSCDSMQIYRDMDIGTAKPDAAARAAVPHHMLDIISPDENYSAARYAREAGAAIKEILSRGRLPVIAGGTGLYLRALLYGLHEAVCDDGGAARERWRQYGLAHGESALFERLQEVDPASAEKIDPNNTRRVLRALEVFSLTGKPLSEHHRLSQQTPPRFTACVIGLWADRAALYERIDRRVDEMARSGLWREVEGLLERGVPESATAMQAIGYKEIVRAIRTGGTPEQAFSDVAQATRRYAKRQITLFTRFPELCWIDITDKNVFSLSTEVVEKFCLP